ncbi:MAG: hypothetical protein J6O99_01285 [Methanobrevibacter sp.]|nr:hypothetical protein [Methanobrevibacter sp.]
MHIYSFLFSKWLQKQSLSLSPINTIESFWTVVMQLAYLELPSSNLCTVVLLYCCTVVLL